MNKINFTKMHGLGNDFIVINALQTPFDISAATISALGCRKTGIGFDQLLVVESADEDGVDFNYRIFNADGSEVEHCGNGARCFAKYVVDKGLTNKHQLTVKVKKGLINTTYHDDDKIEVSMGQPIIIPSLVPFLFSPDKYQKQYQIAIGNGQSLPVSVVSMGNPHAVFLINNIWTLSIEELAIIIQNTDYFPESVNVNFVEVIDKQNINLRTYERGAGETDACGTGACASVFAVFAIGATDNIVTVKTRGGELFVRIDETGHIFMSGPARTVFEGEFSIES